MYTYPLTYTDFLGKERTAEFLFNIEPNELADWHFTKDGGMDKFIEKVIKTEDKKELLGLFRELVNMSYGELSDDGIYFRKSPDILKKFQSTKAYSIIYMALASDADLASKFIAGVLPSEEELQRQLHADK